MPLYEYVCQDCGTHIEVLRPMKDADAPLPCNSCQGQHTTRQLSRVYATSGDHNLIGSTESGGCGGCSGGSCAGCRH